MFGIPPLINNKQNKFFFDFQKRSSHISSVEKVWSIITFILGTIALFFVISFSFDPMGKFISPLVTHLTSLKPLSNSQQNAYEVFGFAPYWTINKLESVDFSTLTTFAYFGVPILAEGGLDKDDYGYTVFKADKATQIFKKAHDNGARVILTITCMDNDTIESFLGSDVARERTINDTIDEVKNRGIDGVNVDVEYVGTPNAYYREQFSIFISELSTRMHKELPSSYVTVSVYASSAKEAKMYDIASIGKSADGVFMMAYDFAGRGSSEAMPTAPLYGHKEGKYSYDIATAVKDFQKHMPANKIILGVPYYGYSYLVNGEPRVKASTKPTWSSLGKSFAQTYEVAMDSKYSEREGWDDLGQVGWKAYYVSEVDAWRMIFLDDARSLGVKYDFAKNNNLGGVGIWALGFDSGKSELWAVLKKKFGIRDLADSRLKLAEIN